MLPQPKIDITQFAPNIGRPAVAAHPEADPVIHSRFRPEWLDTIGHDTAPDYVVKGVFSEGGLSVVFGPPGCGKSFLMTDLGLAVARSMPWFGHRVRGGGVLYVAAEGQRGVRVRLAAYRQAHLSDAATGIPFALLPVPVNLLDKSESAELVKLLEERCLDGAAFRLVIIDTLARTFVGDENDSEDMGSYVAALGAIQAATGAHVTIIHHSGKNTAAGARGHSSLLGAVDTAIEVSRDGDRRTATITKQKDGVDGGAMPFELETVDLGLDDDGDSVTSCIVRPTDTPATGTTRTLLKPQHRQAMALLHECILDLGAPAPQSSHIPRGSKGVTKAQFREYLSKGGLINESGNPREQMKRLLVTLKDQSAIGLWEDFVWPVTPVTTASL